MTTENVMKLGKIERFFFFFFFYYFPFYKSVDLDRLKICKKTSLPMYRIIYIKKKSIRVKQWKIH